MPISRCARLFKSNWSTVRSRKRHILFGHKDTDYAMFMATHAYHKLKVDTEKAAEDLKGTMEALDDCTLLGPIFEGMDVCSNKGLNSFA